MPEMYTIGARWAVLNLGILRVKIMMRRALKICLVAVPAIAGPYLYAKTQVPEKLRPENTLQRYIQSPEPISSPLHFANVNYDKSSHVSCYQYTLTSQVWPKQAVSQSGAQWAHTLKIYRPDTVAHDTALLFVSGGTRNPIDGGHNPPPATLDFSSMANLTHSIIVVLQDVPNQYLTFDDGIQRKEDSIVAYTWRRFLEAPEQGDSWPVHLPMTKAIIKAMDAAQNVALNEWKINLNHFVVAGASKRGWATWLSALADNRVSAIVPVVIDILNTQENIRHIYRSYGCAWPPAFRDYEAEKITSHIETPEFEKLMHIEDPLIYLQGSQGEHYKKRLSIPKYIISASGDDFFVPDSSTLYLDTLPGETRTRVIPNQSHYIDMKIVGKAILGWYQSILTGTERPNISWEHNTDKSVVVFTEGKPTHVKLWQATNPKNCDFRYNAGIRYESRLLQDKEKCDDKNHCRYSVDIGTTPETGCRASFVEATFIDQLGGEMVVTTPVLVQKSTSIADLQTSCVLPGEKLSNQVPATNSCDDNESNTTGNNFRSIFRNSFFSCSSIRDNPSSAEITTDQKKSHYNFR